MSSDTAREASDGRVIVVRKQLRDAMLTGIALTIPILVTLFVLGFVANFVGSTIEPAVMAVRNELGLSNSTPTVAIQAAMLVSFVLGVLGIGLVAELRSGGRIEDGFDAMMERIPGLGSVYTSFNQMSEMLLSNDTQSFQEVFLVEYPTHGSYALGFLTSQTPEFVAEAAGENELVTLFMPMAPNPVMGGFVIHVSADRVYDVDMTVEQGIRSIVTSGVALGAEGDSNIPTEAVTVSGDSTVDPAEFNPQAPTSSNGESGTGVEEPSTDEPTADEQ